MDERSQILICDDDPDIRKVLYLLLRESYGVAEAADGAEAVRYMQAHPETDLVVLDVMMPGMDGFEACDRIRAFSNVPILFLTAKSAEADRISAYGSGGDDFLSKPFSQGEFLAKVRSLLRRYKQYRGKPAPALAIEGLEIDLTGRTVKRGDKEIPLTDTEFSILEHLLKNRGQNRHRRRHVRGRVGGALSQRLGQHRDGACAEPAPEDRGKPLQPPHHPHRLGKGLSN